MRVLYIAPADAGDVLAVPSLRFLPHSIQQVAADTSGLLSAQTADVAVLDATADLSLAQGMRARLDTVGITAPLLIALSEGGFIAALPSWGAHDLFVATATPAELDARLRIALAHAANSHRTDCAGEPQGSTFGSETYDHDVAYTEYGPLHIDTESYTVTVNGAAVALTFKEFELLRFLAANPERVFTRTQLLQDVWGSDYLGGTRTVDVHVRRLRAKLGPELDTAIHTVRNVGYRFSASDLEDHSEESEEAGE